MSALTFLRWTTPANVAKLSQKISPRFMSRGNHKNHMTTLIILLVIVSAGIVAVFVLLLGEQKRQRKSKEELKSQKEANDDIRADNQSLAQEIKRLDAELAKSQEALNAKEDLFLHDPEKIRKRIAELMDQTKLEDIMSKEVVTVNVDSPFSEVARKMREYSVRHLPVVDKNHQLAGLITQRMLYQIKSPRKLMDGEWYYDEEMLNDVILKNVMITDVFTLYPDQSMGKALLKMAYTKCGSIPIVDINNKLLGIVTRRDILKVAAGIYEKKEKS